MAGLWVADDTGSYRSVKALWVADDTGTYRSVKALSVSDDTGAYRGNLLSSIGAGAGPQFGLVAATDTPAWRYVRLTWPITTQPGYRYVIQGAGSDVELYSGTGSTAVLGPYSPGTLLSFTLAVVAPDGSRQRGAAVSIRTANLPAPANLVATAVAQTAVNLQADPVEGSTSYQVFDMVKGVPVFTGPDSKALNVVGLLANTYYDFAVRATYAGSFSPFSNHAIVTTAAAPAGPAAGDYDFQAASATTWTSTGWRPDSDGLYHGNGSAFGSSRGDQSSWFFYGQDRFAGLRNGRVTRLQAYVFRTDDAGTSLAQTYHWLLHRWNGRPGNPFSDAAGFPSGDYGALARGTGGWIDLPVSWGQALVDGSYQGVSFGAVPARYMRHDALSVNANNGLLRFTIG